jgi:protein required for attachment to host cells
MTTTWILVAHRGGARLYAQAGRGKKLSRIEDLPHPAGRLKNQDIDSDRPGRSFDSHGSGRHAMSREVEPTEQVAMQFARDLAQRLERGRVAGDYQDLVLVAEPGFLGVLRAALTPTTAGRVAASLSKDLMHVEDRELPDHLESVLVR